MTDAIRFEEGTVLFVESPDDTTVHLVEGPLAMELRRLGVFRSELAIVSEWLSRIPADIHPRSISQVDSALAEASLLGFCRCFDHKHPLRPLKPKRVFSPENRDNFDRLKAIRNQLIAHDSQLLTGVYSLIKKSRDHSAIKAFSFLISVPFLALREFEILRQLTEITSSWVHEEHERVSDKIVNLFNDLPIEQRKSTPPFTIQVGEPKDFFAPEKPRIKL
ncbi:hypothetical protein [Rhodoplanes elegans]|uniref:hypothetical protein n=1 Tax=Rhodoplanes elegans TaxID=29408 RepID=UPI0011B9490A|nr:hypothetical protein [Rhodoplanes elegans]